MKVFCKWRTTAALTGVIFLAMPIARGDYLTIYAPGSPPSNIGSGVQIVNNAGVAVGSIPGGINSPNAGTYAIKWSAAGTIPLASIDANSNGIPFSINSVGTVVGSATTYDSLGYALSTTAVRWDASSTSATVLGNLGTDSSGHTNSVALAINNAGTAVGYGEAYDASHLPLGDRAMRWDASGTAATELGSLGVNSSGSTLSEAIAINAAGTVIGSSYSNQGNVAVKWDASGTTPTELATLGTKSDGTTASSARAINDSGIIVGSATKYDGSGNSLGSRAVRWDSSGAVTELRDIGAAPTDDQAGAVAINNAGTIIGYAAAPNELGTRAVRWDPTGTAATELGNLGTDSTGFTNTSALAINSSGIIVGAADFHTATNTASHAVYWGPDGVAVDLNTLIDPNSGWTLTGAFGISDTDWIVGEGSFSEPGGHARSTQSTFLIHIPEPADSGILALAASMILRRKRAR
jgi:uncharacterized membrane protein